MEILVVGMRHASIHPDTDLVIDLRLPDRVWDLDLYLRRFGDPSSLTKRRVQHRFTDVEEYVTVTTAAVIMEGLFIEKAACKLRYMQFSARSYCLTPESTECIVVIDLADRDLSKHFGGIKDTYFAGSDMKKVTIAAFPRRKGGGDRIARRWMTTREDMANISTLVVSYGIAILRGSIIALVSKELMKFLQDYKVTT